MATDMNGAQVRTLKQMRQVVAGTQYRPEPLRQLAAALTDLQAAEELNEASQALFRRVPARTGIEASVVLAGADPAEGELERRAATILTDPVAPSLHCRCANAHSQP